MKEVFIWGRAALVGHDVTAGVARMTTEQYRVKQSSVNKFFVFVAYLDIGSFNSLSDDKIDHTQTEWRNCNMTINFIPFLWVVINTNCEVWDIIFSQHLKRGMKKEIKK